MDPLSIVAGVVGLAAVAAQTIKLANNFVRDVRGSKQQAQKMIEGLEILRSILKQLNSRLQGSPDLNLAANNSVLDSTIRSCKRRVEDVQRELLKALKGSKVFSALRWPLSKEDHEASLRDINVFAQWIQLALTVDNGAILSRTLEQVNDIFTAHAESAAVLGDINSMSV